MGRQDNRRSCYQIRTSGGELLGTWIKSVGLEFELQTSHTRHAR